MNSTTEHFMPVPVREALLEIVAEVAEAYGVTVEELTGPSRHWFYRHPRRLIAQKAIDAGYTYRDIGAVLNRDHTNVYQWMRKLKKMGRA